MGCRSIEELINDLCKIVLTKGDRLDIALAEEYINNLTEQEQGILNSEREETKKQNVRAITQKIVYKYIDSFDAHDGIYTPFNFDNANEFFEFKEEFFKKYKLKANTSDTHVVFYYVFDYIKEASETYRLFEKFYTTRQNETEKKIKEVLDSAIAEFKVSAKGLVENAYKSIIKKASDSTRKMLAKTQEASETLSKKVSETSVTILGIFSGIVVTIVAGLFYSASVLNNLNNSNLFRLISIVSLVGLITYYLIYAMFWFILTVKGNCDHSKFSKKPTRIITIILLFIFFVSLIVQVACPDFTAKYSPLSSSSQQQETSTGTNRSEENKEAEVSSESSNDISN